MQGDKTDEEILYYTQFKNPQPKKHSSQLPYILPSTEVSEIDDQKVFQKEKSYALPESKPLISKKLKGREYERS